MEAALSSMDAAKKRLFEELAERNVNVLRVRALCRDYPGIIATTGLRIRIWTLLLLGPDYKISADENRDIKMPEEACDEQHVLEADVRRTRSEVEEFRSAAWRSAVQSLLQSFCLSHKIQYKQGMNEVLAPFISIHPPPKGTALPYALFEAFLFRYLERHLCLDDSSFLFKAFRLFHVLLLYFDPQLALHLKIQEFPPELYSPQWFLTLYSRTLPLQHTLRLWDMIIAVDDPAFTFFIGLCLLRRKRDRLLRSDSDVIPEVIQNLGFQGEEDIDSVMCEAIGLYKKTPRCLTRNLRLCCVATTQLSSTPVVRSRHSDHPEERTEKHQNITDKEKHSKDAISIESHDQAMSVQAARGCLMLQTRELLDSLQSTINSTAPTDNDDNSRKMKGKLDGNTTVLSLKNPSEVGSSSTSAKTEKSNSTNSTPQKSDSTTDVEVRNQGLGSTGGIWGGVDGGGVGSDIQQYVLVDVRETSEIESSGGGHLSCAVRLDPEFLDRPDTFAIWLQHLDCMRGCNICIIDMPPVVAHGGKTLWRRLLLGEGDGSGKSRGLFGGDGSSKSNHTGEAAGFRDLESTYAAAEKAAIADDSVRPAVRLALALQRDSFPFISVLEEGFPKFIEILSSSSGSLEPIVLGHDPVKWERFLTSTGRSAPTSRRGSEVKALKSESDNRSNILGRKVEITTPSDNGRSNAPVGMGGVYISPGVGFFDHDSKHRIGPRITIKKKDPLTDLEVAQMAYMVAMKLGHRHMEQMLLDRVNEVMEKEKKNIPSDIGVSESDSPSDWY